MTRALESMATVELLADKLNRLEKVRRYDTTDDKQAWTLAHALSDIEGCAVKLVTELVPAIVASQEDDDIVELLGDIGEEFRHILYHIKDAEYYSYLDP